MKKITIKDDSGNDYVLDNYLNFKNHIIKYHSVNGEGDNSLHLENERYFTVTKEFYNSIISLEK
jgi:hypothetical protein